jgi:hypothetical protein
MNQQLPVALLAAVAVAAMPASAPAAVLSQAKITHIVRDVQTVDPAKAPRPAKLREVVKGRQAVRTGIDSRTELLFNDLTLTRIGANSQFSFSEGTRELELYRGVILLQVPKGSGGAKIHTAAVTAAVPGTPSSSKPGRVTRS